MKEKFLPIGTVCTLKGKNKKTIIIGYFSIEYKGNAIMYDYSGYDYPEGLLANTKYSFNHSDINNIDYLGYMSKEYNILNKKLLGQLNTEINTKLETNSFFKNIKFDENGVVVFEELLNPNLQQNNKTNRKSTHLNTQKKEQNNVFQNNEFRPSNIIEDAENAKNWSIFKKIKFDENGTVIEAEEFNDKEKQENNMLRND